MKRARAVLAWIVVVTLAGACMWSSFSPVVCFPQNRNTRCLSALKHVTLSMLVYAEDYDGRLPGASDWMERSKDYMKSGLAGYRCSEITEPGFGFAFRDTMAGVDVLAFSDEAPQPFLFDSVDCRWNAHGGYGLIPSQGRHEGKSSIGFADGHAAQVVRAVIFARIWEGRRGAGGGSRP